MTPEGLASRAGLVLDPRLAEVWQLVWAWPSEDPGARSVVTEEVLAALLRLAYLQGFADAKDEPVEGDLYRELGICVPAATTTRTARLPGGPRRRRSSGT